MQKKDIYIYMVIRLELNAITVLEKERKKERERERRETRREKERDER